LIGPSLSLHAGRGLLGCADLLAQAGELGVLLRAELLIPAEVMPYTGHKERPVWRMKEWSKRG